MLAKVKKKKEKDSATTKTLKPLERKRFATHNSTKYIAIFYHFIREAIENGEIQLTKRDNINCLTLKRWI